MQRFEFVNSWFRFFDVTNRLYVYYHVFNLTNIVDEIFPLFKSQLEFFQKFEWLLYKKLY
jgi:hypothetical protein